MAPLAVNLKQFSVNHIPPSNCHTVTVCHNPCEHLHLCEEAAAFLSGQVTISSVIWAHLQLLCLRPSYVFCWLVLLTYGSLGTGYFFSKCFSLRALLLTIISKATAEESLVFSYCLCNAVQLPLADRPQPLKPDL